MYDILEYVKKNLKTFDNLAFNEIDALVFSWISYYRLPKAMYKNKSSSIQLKDLYNRKDFDDLLFDIFDTEKSRELLSCISSSPRFRDIEMLYYVQKTSKKVEKQFSAMAFKINKKELVVAFRGTDHSFVGWKEDLNMSFMRNIPSQIEAKKYLDKVMENTKGSVYVVGHSKGGNLSVYASCFLKKEYRHRVLKVYNFDGPNLNKDLISTIEYKRIKSKINKFVPQSSVVGMCFDKTSDYKIIKSNAIGVLQHSPFSWEIENNKLKVLKDTTFDSKMFKNGINALINDLSEDELRVFADTIYSVIEETNTDTVEELMANLGKNMKIILGASMNLDESQKKVLSKVSEIFFKESFKISKS